MPPETNTSSRSIRVHPIGIETVWAQCVERMDKHLVAAMGLSGISSARSHNPPDGGCMTSPNAPGILAAVLDQLLAGVDPRSVFLPNGLLDELKNAPVGHLLDAGMDRGPAGDGTGSLPACVPPQGRHGGARPAWSGDNAQEAPIRAIVASHALRLARPFASAVEDGRHPG